MLGVTFRRAVCCSWARDRYREGGEKADSERRFMEGFISGVQVVYLCLFDGGLLFYSGEREIESWEEREREVWLLSCFAQSGALWAAVVNWSRAGRQELHYWITTMTRVLSTAVLLQRENDRGREREGERWLWKMGPWMWKYKSAGVCTSSVCVCVCGHPCLFII